MSIRKNIRNLLPFILIVYLVSCVRDDFDKLSTSNWEPEFALALVDSRFGIDRIVNRFEEEGSLITDEDNVIVVIYRGQVFNVRADEVIALSDLSFDLAVFQGELPMDFPGLALSNLNLAEGTLRVHVEEAIGVDYSVTLNMPGATRNGKAFEETFIVRYKGTAATVFDTIYDLAGYNFNLTGSGGQYRNRMSITYTAHRLIDSKQVNLDKCILSFEDLSFRFLDGYLGQLDFGVFKDSMRVFIYEKYKSGTILLEDPKFELLIRNGFGMPVNVRISSFSGSGFNGNVDLKSPAITNGIDVGSPAFPESPSTNTHVIFNNQNSNVTNFIAITPQSVNYEFGLRANTSGDPNQYNFAFDSSRITGDLYLELPLKGSIDSVIFEDVYDFDAYDLKNIEVALFKLHTVNAFPLGVYFQLYFLDVEENTLDSLILDNDIILKEAKTDERGFTVTPSFEESYFAVGRRRFDDIKKSAVKLKLRAMLLTDDADTKTIRITSEDYFDIKIGVRAVVTYQE